MDMDDLEIECPVCDRRVRADAPRCPYCGAEYVMSGVDELEKVAQELNGRPAPERPVAVEPLVEAATTVEAAEVVTGPDDEKGGKGLLGKLFRKWR